MADAAVRESEDGEDLAALQEETSPFLCMPHLQHSASELDTRYPRLVAPPDDGLVDVADDRGDAVYQHGLGIARDIRRQVAAQGRRRRPEGLAEDSGAQIPEAGVEASSSKGGEDNHTEVPNLVAESTTTGTAGAPPGQTDRIRPLSLRRSDEMWLPVDGVSMVTTGGGGGTRAVSYTHLTLPTIYSV